jgi:hypothetical protein
MTQPKFYKTVYRLEVLSETPYAETDLEVIAQDITVGEQVGQLTEVESVTLTPEAMAEAMHHAGSSPEFFGLTDDGESLR